MAIDNLQEKERQSAAAVIDWMERVVFAVERADYEAASHAMNLARVHLNTLQAFAEIKEKQRS